MFLMCSIHYVVTFDPAQEFLMEVDSKKANPGKGGMKLLSKIFTDEELSTCCYKNTNGRCSKQELDQKRVKLHKSKSVYIYILYCFARHIICRCSS